MLKEIAVDLYRNEVFKIGRFTLKSGDISPFYLDLRLIPSIPDLFTKVVSIYSKIVEELGGQCIAGIMSAGIPFATGVCLELNLPLLQIRSNVKDHGTKKMVEGIVSPEHEVILLDDLISTGASKLEPYQQLIKLGAKVNHLVVLVDRTSDEKVKQLLQADGLELHSAGTIDDLFEALKESDEVAKEELEQISDAFDKWKLQGQSN